MAKIRKLDHVNHAVRPHKSEVDATYQVILDGSGGTLFHLSTYGSDQRASLPKVSQTIQLDHETAAQLILALRIAFGDDVVDRPVD